MVSIFDPISVVSGILGIIQFGIDNFPQEKPSASTVRITVGLDIQGGLSNSGGDLPAVTLFNEGGGYLGRKTHPGKISSGDFHDITIEHFHGGGQQATYALFAAHNDAICIAYTSITWPSGDQYGWTGDWAPTCGGNWYYSNVYLSGSNKKLDCMWIDGNGDQPQTGFQVHWPEFVNTTENPLPNGEDGQKAKVDYLCNSGPPFKMYENPNPNSIVFWPQPDHQSSRDAPATESLATEKPLSARFRSMQHGAPASHNQPGGLTLMNRHLVISDLDQHSAAGLCESATSFGPDFLNTRTGTFCRMANKSIWPVCDGAQIVDNCFDSGRMQLVINGISARNQPYQSIIDWRSENSTVV
ncbi:hypothetical protein EKO27_g7314 [Xylaria grammica]|uniref:Uncharacterized protein n=1 Tax=Xylaria grammica TaxID=363999 RepID=A0A439D0K6_9PEZI|nr:hypothetical protein EKO27_g7314 [Xylaria grammica]